MSLPSQCNPAFENRTYHALPQHELEKLNDPEAIFEKGRRLRTGTGMKQRDEAGWEFYIMAAHAGHAVAMASCYYYGKGTQADLAQSVRFYQESAARGHPACAIATPRTKHTPNTRIIPKRARNTRLPKIR
jgi:TPR repeat protein